MSTTASAPSIGPKAAKPAKWTELDRLAYTDLARYIAFTVADGRQPDDADLVRFRRLTNKRDAYLGVEASFQARG